jgi:hypothetical protein
LSSRTNEKLRAFTKFNETGELLGFPVSLSARTSFKKTVALAKSSASTVVHWRRFAIGER